MCRMTVARQYGQNGFFGRQPFFHKTEKGFMVGRIWGALDGAGTNTWANRWNKGAASTSVAKSNRADLPGIIAFSQQGKSEHISQPWKVIRRT